MEAQRDAPHSSFPQTRGVTLRAVLFSIPLIFINCYWVLETEGIWHSNHATAMSLFWNTTFFLFLIVLFNVFVLKRALPNWALSQGELITIYVMMTIATALAGHDSLQLGIPAVGGFLSGIKISNRLWDGISSPPISPIGPW
jgi:hypothetical protein